MLTEKMLAASSPPYATWTRRLSIYETNISINNLDIGGIAYNGTTYIGSCPTSTIRKSTDLTTWTTNSIPISPGNVTVSEGTCWYENGVFFVTGDNGGLASSTDGTTWTDRSFASTSVQTEGVAYGNSIYVVITQNSIRTSTTLATWTTRLSSINVRALVWNGTQFLVVGSTNSYISTDGITWTTYSISLSDVRCLVWTGSQYIAAGSSGFIATSPDGITWTTRTSGTSADIDAVATNGSITILGTDTGVMYSSTDGITWTSRGRLTVFRSRQAIWDGAQFILVGSDGTIIVSTNGTTWSLYFGQSPIYGFSYSSSLGKYAASGAGVGTIQTSSDGNTWLGTTPFSPGLTSEDLRKVVWGDIGYFVGVSNTGGDIFYSSNGTSWSKTAGGIADPYGIGWANNLFVAVGSSGTMATAPTYTGWTTRTTGVTAILYDVAWNGSLAVVVGASGTIITSPDCVTWTTRTSGVTSTLYGVTWTGTQFVVVGSSGRVLTSSDGITWTIRTSISGSPTLYAVAWDGYWILAGSSTGTIYLSLDGISWQSRTTSTTQAIYQIFTVGNKTYATGESCNIMSSTI